MVSSGNLKLFFREETSQLFITQGPVSEVYAIFSNGNLTCTYTT